MVKPPDAAPSPWNVAERVPSFADEVDEKAEPMITWRK